MDTTTGGSGSLGNELHSDARTITHSAKQRIYSEVDARKGGAAEQVKAVSSALDRAGEELGQQGPAWLRSAFQSTAQAVQRLADTVEHKDARQLSRDAQQIARENPASFLAACAVAGFAAARVMQAGRTSSNGRSQSLAQGSYGQGTSGQFPYGQSQGDYGQAGYGEALVPGGAQRGAGYGTADPYGAPGAGAGGSLL